jgi:hypothetical protein
LLYNAQETISQLYHDENKLHLNGMTMKTKSLKCGIHCGSSLKQQSASSSSHLNVTYSRHDTVERLFPGRYTTITRSLMYGLIDMMVNRISTNKYLWHILPNTHGCVINYNNKSAADLIHCSWSCPPNSMFWDTVSQKLYFFFYWSERAVKIHATFSEWVSDCCLTPNEQICRHILARASYTKHQGVRTKTGCQGNVSEWGDMFTSSGQHN